jgi:hypothetical protein
MAAPDDHHQRHLTAHHEAGHAVAALMRGGGELVSVTIEPTAEYAGHTGLRSKPFDIAFVTYAGPWAEARAQWPAEVPLDAEDGDGCVFDDYILAAWWANATGDLAEYKRRCEADAELLGDHAHLLHLREETWCRELDDRWPAIQQIAKLLMSRPVDDDEVRAAMLAAP